MFETVSPVTGEAIHQYRLMEDSTMSSILDKAHEAFLEWKKKELPSRSRLILQVRDRLLQHQARYAKLITEEMGKVTRESLAEIKKCAWVCEYYAENAQKFLADEWITIDAQESFITYQPLGVVFSIMPWNFPFWQFFRFAIPALMAGNAIILKHAKNVTGCALAMEEIFKSLDFPENLFRVLLISHEQVEKAIQHSGIQAVTFTGGSEAGRQIGKIAGKNLKKSVLELGGSDPYIILADADLEKAAHASCESRLSNAGQSCIAAKRFIVIGSVYSEFLKICQEKVRSITIGDPYDLSVGMGPLSSVAQRDQLHQQVQASIEKGAECILGGEIPAMTGAYYPPTLLTGVKKGMPAYDEELFGPVISIITVNNVEEAIKVANDSPYGLGGAVFSGNKEEGKKVALQIESGSVAVNDLLRSDPRMPFGGVKESGYGRELSSVGIKEFTNIKSIRVAEPYN